MNTSDDAIRSPAASGKEISQPQGVAKTPPAINAPAHIPFEALTLPDNKLLEEAVAKNWTSEKLSEVASERLKQLQRVILDLPGAADLPWVDTKIKVGSMHQPLVEVFQDDSFTVLRPTAAAPTSTSLVGPEELISQLQQFDAADGEASRFEQKVVSVSLEASQLKTRSLVHIVSDTKDGVIQRNLQWTCVWSRDDKNQLSLLSIQTTDFEEVRVPRKGFVDCTQSVLEGTKYWQHVLSRSTDYWLDRLETRYGLDPSAWHGLAIGDVNGDGLEDIYVCQAGGIPNGLLLQQSDGTLRDGSGDSGVDLYDQTQSALLVDIDDDGDLDLVAAISTGVMVFSNDGQGTFSPRTAKLLPEGVPYALSAADFDQDGDLDLYACCYAKRRSELDHRFLGRPIPYHDANNGARNALLRNEGNWEFRDVTQAVGLGNNNQRFSFAASWEDYDNDGDLDLYVANDYGRNNLYRNQNGQFQDVASEAGVEDMSAGMSVSWGDVNNDGWMDLYVSNMFSSAGNRIAYQRQFQSTVDEATRAGYQRHARGNSLFLNAGNGTFEDVSDAAQVTMGRWAWGSSIIDLNMDGLQDIVVANGFLTQENPDDL